MIRYADLEPLRQSAFGHYIAKTMSRTIEGVRLFGDLVMIFGAWKHDVLLIVLGLAVIVGAWCNGLIPSKVRTKKS